MKSFIKDDTKSASLEMPSNTRAAESEQSILTLLFQWQNYM